MILLHATVFPQHFARQNTANIKKQKKFNFF